MISQTDSVLRSALIKLVVAACIWNSADLPQMIFGLDASIHYCGYIACYERLKDAIFKWYRSGRSPVSLKNCRYYPVSGTFFLE